MVSPDMDRIESVLDVAKVCDSVIFLLSATQDIDEWGDTLLSSVLGRNQSETRML